MKYTHISEGGKARNFSARKLRTKLSGGGTCLWVPSDTVVRASKNVSENGEYTAANEGIYAYEQINVSRYVNKICGNKNGVPYIAYSSNGQIYEQELPTEIRVTTNPTKTQYQNGEYVDYTGIVVKAYDSNGNLWTSPNYPDGVVPFNELILPSKMLDINTTPKCWGDTYKVYISASVKIGLSPYEPIYYYRVSNQASAIQYNKLTALNEYTKYDIHSIVSDEPLYLLRFNVEDRDQIPDEVKNIYQSKGLSYNGKILSRKFNYIMYSKTPYSLYWGIFSKRHNEQEERTESNISVESHQRQCGVDRSDNTIHPTGYINPLEDVHNISFTSNSYLGLADWYSMTMDGEGILENMNEDLYDEVSNNFRDSSGSIKDIFIYTLGYILLYGNDFVVDRIGWNRPGDGLTLYTHFPIKINGGA